MNACVSTVYSFFRVTSTHKCNQSLFLFSFKLSKVIWLIWSITKAFHYLLANPEIDSFLSKILPVKKLLCMHHQQGKEYYVCVYTRHKCYLSKFCSGRQGCIFFFLFKQEKVFSLAIVIM